MAKVKILILSLTHQDNDPRVIRQINFLKDNYDIYCAGLSNNFFPKEKFYQLKIEKNSLPRVAVLGSLILSRLYSLTESYIVRSRIKMLSKAEELSFDLILANDIDSVPLAYGMFKSKKVIADFHEFAPSEFEDKLYWRHIHRNYAIHQCKKYFPSLNAMTTVCKSIAKEYDKNFRREPVVITNAAEYTELKPTQLKNKFRMIHHGAAISSRKIEIMIETAKLLRDRFTLDLMLVPNEKEYFEKLKTLAAGSDNIKFIEPVSFDKIVTFCNSYDIGIFILPPVNLNYKYALPNKFFEFIQSRLAVITGPSEEMAGYIDRYKLGLHTKSFDPREIAEEINKLTDQQIIRFKNNTDKHAKELSSEGNKKILNNIVKEVLDK